MCGSLMMGSSFDDFGSFSGCCMRASILLKLLYVRRGGWLFTEGLGDHFHYIAVA